MTMRNITTASLVLLLHHPLLVNAFSLPSQRISIHPHTTSVTTTVQQQQSQYHSQQQEQLQKQYINNRFSSSLMPLSSTSSSSSENTATPKNDNQKSIAIISPPGGIGEITAVRAAEMGASVRWFVVTPPPPPSGSSTFSLDAFPKIPWFGGDNNDDDKRKTNTGKEKENTAASTASVVRFSAYTLASIQAAGGSIELAGASADALLSDDNQNDDNNKSQQQQQQSSSTFSSAAEAAAAWCGSAVVTDGGIVCCYDGITEAVDSATIQFGLRTVEEDEAVKMGRAMAGAVRVATAATCRRSDSFGDGGRRIVAILPAGSTNSANDEMWEEEMEEEDVFTLNNQNNNDDGEDDGGGGVVAEVGDAAEALLGSFLEGVGRKGMVKIPPTLENALVGDYGKSSKSSSSLSASVFVLRHGELFGEPDSSVSLLFLCVLYIFVTNFICCITFSI